MYERFGYPGLFAAYNAGPARYSEHLAGRRRLPSETVGYLVSVAPDSHVREAVVVAKPPASALFAVRKAPPPAAKDGANAPPPNPIFVALSQGN